METENQESMKIGIGIKEPQTLQPAKVKILRAYISIVGDKKLEILKCEVKHPDKEEPITISEAKYEGKDGKLRISALWVNKDEEGLIVKGSTLAILLNHAKVNTCEELKDKEFDTALDDKNYLALKAY